VFKEAEGDLQKPQNAQGNKGGGQSIKGAKTYHGGEGRALPAFSLRSTSFKEKPIEKEKETKKKPELTEGEPNREDQNGSSTPWVESTVPPMK